MKYILYCRKSTDTEDKQVLSLESQEKELLDLAALHEYDVVDILRESRTAKEPGRPIFNELIRRLSAGEVDAILCWKIDRLTRNPVDGGQIQWLLQKGRIKSICTPSRTYNPDDNVLLMSIEQAMATQYIRELSENVKRGYRAKLEKGEWPNHAPYGYKNDKATKLLVFDEKQSPMVQRTFELFASGLYSMSDVRRMLNAEGFRTSAGTKIGKSTVERIIKNPFYFGMMERNGKYYEGKHQPLISKALFDQAQDVLNNVTRPKTQELLFPLRGLLICADCTCQYTASLKKGHQYYYCTNGKGICEAHSRYMRSEPATVLISKAIAEVKIDVEMIDIMYEAQRERYADSYSYTEAIQKRLQSQLETLERQEIKAFEDSSSGLLRQELYERKMRDIQKHRFLVQKELNELRLQNGLATLEPIKEAFLKGNTAQNRFIEAKPEQQKIIASEVLWNLSIKDRNIQEVRYRSYFDVMAKMPKKGDLAKMLRG
jgi:site-specific DNA recombinase